MPTLLAVVVEVTKHTTYAWNNTPTIVGLLFGLAGTFFVSIYYLRRRQSK